MLCDFFLLLLLYRLISCSVHCYYCYCYCCCCLLCCCYSVVLNLSLSQPRGFVFHSLCGGGAAAAWSQTLAGTKPPQMTTNVSTASRKDARALGLGPYFILMLVISPHTNTDLSLQGCQDFKTSQGLNQPKLTGQGCHIRITKNHPPTPAPLYPPTDL